MASTPKKAPDLCPPDEAIDLLGVTAEEFQAMIDAGDLRFVRPAKPTDEGAVVLGADVDKALADADPRELAKRVSRPGGGTRTTAAPEIQRAIDATPRL